MADSACGVTLVKQFTYRGNSAEEWSNTYWFTQSTPSDATAWKALADAVAASEKIVYPSTTKIVRAYGYDSPNDVTGEHAAWTYDYLGAAESISGTYVPSAAIPQAGDDAWWIRWRTTRRTSPGGKLIYLRKYFHPPYTGSGGGDSVVAALRTLGTTHGNKMIDGTLPSARKLCAMHHTEDAASFDSGDVEVSTYVTTRTLKRRGKRNPT